MKEVSVFWFRRDLRLEDNAGLWKALKNGYPVVPIFIFDANILNRLEDKKDARVSYLHQNLLYAYLLWLHSLSEDTTFKSLTIVYW